VLRRTSIALLVAVASLGVAGPVAATVPLGSGAATTNRGDDARTAWYPSADAPRTNRVATRYQQAFSTALGGQVLAQPVISQGTLIVATETDVVAGLNPLTGAVIWQRTLGTPVASSVDGCGDLSPWRGVTSTPVVDPTTGSVFIMDEESVAGVVTFELHKIDPTTGVEQPSFPLTVAGSASNQRSTSFVASEELQRPGLLELDGKIFAGFASHCDDEPWNGWIDAVATDGSSQVLWAAEPAAKGQAGIWQAGAGLASDGDRQLLMSTGNGPGMAAGTPGTSPGRTLGDSAVRLHLVAKGTLKATDFFAPYDQTLLAAGDFDFGSGGITVLPTSMGSPATPRLLTAVSKGGWLYLLDATSLGGTGRGVNGADAVVARVQLGGKILATASVSPDDSMVYVTTMGTPGAPGIPAPGRSIVAVQVTNINGRSGLKVVARSPGDMGLGASSPSISTRTSPGGGLGDAGVLWVSRCNAGLAMPCTDASLDAYDATPSNGQLVELASWPIGNGAKFAQPLVAGGMVYVGTATGVAAVGEATRGPVTATSSLNVAAAPVSSTASVRGTLRITSATPVTITSVALSSSAISADQAALTAASTTPATSFQIPITVDTSQLEALGEHTSLAAVSTSGGTTTTPLVVRTTPAGPFLLERRPPRFQSIGGVAPGQVRTVPLTLTNIGLAPLHVTGVSLPAAPFFLSGFSPVGATIQPGATLTYSVGVIGVAGQGVVSSNMSVATDGGNAQITLTAVTSP
jgi:outer membrane protein assembly factor BamB